MLKITQLSGFGGRLFTPKQISGLQMWLKADSLGLSDGSAVSTWSDSSGNGNNATQGTANNQPVLKTNIANGLPVVRFAQGTGDTGSIGTADYLTLPNFSALTAGEIHIVIKINADPPAVGNQGGLWKWIDTGTDTGTNFPFTDGVVYESFGTSVRKTTGNPTLSLSSAFRIYSVYSASADWQSFVDGVSHFSTGTNTVQFSSTVYLGRSFDGTGNAWLNGDVAEVLLWNRKLSTSERDLVVGYLKRRYAL